MKKTGRPRKTEEERKKTAVLSVRLPVELLEGVDGFAKNLSERVGFEVSRNSAISLLLQRGIAHGLDR